MYMSMYMPGVVHSVPLVVTRLQVQPSVPSVERWSYDGMQYYLCVVQRDEPGRGVHLQEFLQRKRDAAAAQPSADQVAAAVDTTDATMESA